MTRTGIAFGICATLALAAGTRDAASRQSPRPSAFLCENPSSKATWTIHVDYQRGLVDSFPATIAADRLTWTDAKQGGNYELDLASGNLTATFASSTGGYFLHDHCVAER